jgi:hypothetical protein
MTTNESGESFKFILKKHRDDPSPLSCVKEKVSFPKLPHALNRLTASNKSCGGCTGFSPSSKPPPLMIEHPVMKHFLAK